MVETCCTAPFPNVESCSDSVLEDDSINFQRYWHLLRLRPVTPDRVSEQCQLHDVCQYSLPVAGCRSSTQWPSSRRLIHRAAVRLSGPRICAAQSDRAIENWRQPILHRECSRFSQRLVLLRCNRRVPRCKFWRWTSVDHRRERTSELHREPHRCAKRTGVVQPGLRRWFFCSVEPRSGKLRLLTSCKPLKLNFLAPWPRLLARPYAFCTAAMMVW